MLDSIKKLTSTVKRLDIAVEKALSAPSKKEISKAEQEISAQLHSLQYGVGVSAIEIKRVIDGHRTEVD